MLGLQESVRRRGGSIFRRSGERLLAHNGKPKSFGYLAESGKKLERNFCPDCGARLYTSNLEAFPATIFFQFGRLDRPEFISPKLGMFTRHRLKLVKPMDMPQFDSMPHEREGDRKL